MLLHVAAGLLRAGCGQIIVLTGANHARLRSALGLLGDAGLLTVDAGVAVPFSLRFSGDMAGTGGRLSHISADEFGDGALLSYTDVFTDGDLAGLQALRVQNDAALALLAVNPRQPWGELALAGNNVTGFNEKPVATDRWINGGFFAVDARVLGAISDPSDSLEREVITRLIAQGQVVAKRHAGWWASVNTAKELRQVEGSAAATVLQQSRPVLADS